MPSSIVAQDVELLSRERDYLTRKIDLSQTAIHQSTLAILAVLGSLAAVYWQEKIASDVETRSWLLYALTQIGVFLMANVIYHMTHQNVAAGHIAAIELRLNNTHEQIVSAWESQTSPRFLQHWGGVLRWVITTLLVLVLCFTLAIVLALSRVLPTGWTVTLLAEVLLLVVLWVAATREVSRVRDWTLAVLQSRPAAAGDANPTKP